MRAIAADEFFAADASPAAAAAARSSAMSSSASSSLAASSAAAPLARSRAYTGRPAHATLSTICALAST